MSYTSHVTLTGFIAGEPQLFSGDENKRAFFSARMGSTPRRFDSETKEWSDGNTTWFDVYAFGALAENANKSLEKGTPIIVSGVLTSRVWEDSEGNERTTNLIKATALGPNLTFGTANFQRGTHSDDQIAETEEEAAKPEPEKKTKK